MRCRATQCQDQGQHTCEDEADTHKGPSLGLGLLGPHADVDDLPSGVGLEHLGLARRQDACEWVTCGRQLRNLRLVWPSHLRAVYAEYVTQASVKDAWHSVVRRQSMLPNACCVPNGFADEFLTMHGFDSSDLWRMHPSWSASLVSSADERRWIRTKGSKHCLHDAVPILLCVSMLQLL